MNRNKRRIGVFLVAAATNCVVTVGLDPSGVAQEETAVEQVSGRVYVDANGNGRLDSGEHPLTGVRITDSMGFAVSGDDGGYTIRITPDPQIPYAPARVVSVSWPSGYWPSGPWWRRLSTIRPGESVDFGLREDSQKLPLTFTHVGDDHGVAAVFGPGTKFRDMFAELFQNRAKFCINTGDFGYCTVDDSGKDNQDEMFSQVLANTRDFPLPMFYAQGNHDICGRTAESWRAPRRGYWGFTKYLGPVRWSFSCAGVHFVAVDWANMASGEYDEGVPEVAAEWLDQDLAAQPSGTRTFLFVHFFFGCQKYVDVIAKHRVTHMFGGHNHKDKEYDVNGVPGSTVLNAGSRATLVGIVQSDGYDVVHYCGGCKDDPHYHNKRCALAPSLPLLASVAGRRKGPAGTTGLTVTSGSHDVLNAANEPVEVKLAFKPGTAKRCGLRFGGRDPVEVAFTGDTLVVAGAEVPFVPRPIDGGVRWHVIVEGDKLVIFANNLLRLIKKVRVDEPGRVKVFAEDGGVTFDSLDTWTLAPADAAVATP